MPAIAFFDLDKTILSRSSALAFAGPLYRAGLIRRTDVARSAVAQLSLVTGRLDHAGMERIRSQLSATVRGWSVAELAEVIDTHLDAVVTPLVFAEARDLITRHQAAGDLVVIVTSTGHEMAGPVAAVLGVEQVLATRMAVSGGHYTGDIDDYMYGPRKAEAIRDFAAGRRIDLADCSAYSDSSTDLPMLSVVGHPHAVNPDAGLRRVARENGWPVHEFRSEYRPRTRSAVGIGASIVAIAAAGVAVRAGLRDRRRPRR